MLFPFPDASRIQQLANTRSDAKNISARYCTLLYKDNKLDFVTKFLPENVAQWHSDQTDLYRYFGLPFSPCKIYPIELKIDYFNDSHIREIDNHVMVMPYIKGSLLRELEDQDYKKSQAFHPQLIQFLPQIILTGCEDIHSSNVIISNNRKIHMIDPEIGLFAMKPEYETSEACMKDLFTRYSGNYYSIFVRNAEKSRKIESSIDKSRLLLEKKIQMIPENLPALYQAKEILFERLEMMPLMRFDY